MTDEVCSLHSAVNQPHVLKLGCLSAVFSHSVGVKYRIGIGSTVALAVHTATDGTADVVGPVGGMEQEEVASVSNETEVFGTVCLLCCRGKHKGNAASLFGSPTPDYTGSPSFVAAPQRERLHSLGNLPYLTFMGRCSLQASEKKG